MKLRGDGAITVVFEAAAEVLRVGFAGVARVRAQVQRQLKLGCLGFS